MQQVIFKIGVLVYNHEQYLTETLNSLINQKTKFSYEIYIFEDYSTDNSREIVKKFSLDYPEKIKPILNSKNFSDFWNLRANFKYLDSKYFALLDGDDCWNNDLKIEQMISFLEEHPKFMGVSHNVRLEFDDERPTELLNKNSFDRSEHTIFDLISGYCYHHTSSLIYRNYFCGKLPQIYFHPYAGDWFFSMLFAEHGPIKYFDYVWSTYRIHKKGIWSKLDDIEKQMRNIDSCFHYNRLLNYKYDLAFGRMHYEIQRLLPNFEKNFSGRMRLLKYQILFYSLNSHVNKFRWIRKLLRPFGPILCSNVKVKPRP